jgi:hypothetical protein
MSKPFLALGAAAILVIAVLAAYQFGLLATGPHVSVSPAANLIEGQSVSVTVSGFPASSTVRISECATAASANDLGCGADLTVQTAAVTGADGSGSITFAVRAQAAAGPLQTGPIEACSAPCVIVATTGAGSAFASTPIAFEAP